MKEIKLTQGQVALVDDEDYEYLNQWKWHAVKLKNLYYASRSYHKNKHKCIAIRMHWAVLPIKENLEIDHIDHNGLNNQKSNLRLCTHQQNSMNMRSYSKSKYHGVGYVGNTIRARINLNGCLIHIGCFKTEIEAAKAYDKKAKELFGEFANLNFK